MKEFEPIVDSIYLIILINFSLQITSKTVDLHPVKPFLFF